MRKAIVSGCMLAAVLSGVSAPAAASTFDKRAHFTFSQPIALPGVTLPAGTYVFRLASPHTERKVVQVTDSSGTQSYAMLLTMPATRLSGELDSEIQFMETGAGMPAAVKTWWYVGDTIGYEFIYPREQARRLMSGLPPEPDPVASATAARATTINEGREPAETELAGGVAPENDTASVEERVNASIATGAAQQPAPAPAPETAGAADPGAAGQDVRDELPRTAGPVPLVILLGLATVFGGWFLTRKS